MESGTKVTGKRHVIQTVPFLMSKLCNIGKKVEKKAVSRGGIQSQGTKRRRKGKALNMPERRKK